MEHSSFLPEKYPDLAGSKPVDRAVKKARREGASIPDIKGDRVEAYLDRLESISTDERGVEILKHKILEKYVTKYADIPESYWTAQETEARKRGESGDWAEATPKQKEEVKKKHAETVLADQRASLEQWVDYFASAESNYASKPIKYWIFRNILTLGELIKKKEGETEHIEFPKRSKGTVKPFPDLNHEALSYLVDAVVKKLEGRDVEFEYDIQPEERQAFLRHLEKEDFAKLYAWANELMRPIPEHLLPVTEGVWVKYEQGSDPHALVPTIRGRGTGWCTAGENTAKTQLQEGDFYVYYSNDDEGKPTVPRIAIRMEGEGKIAEDPRGIAYKQNLDPYMTPILEAKLKEFGPAGEAYKQKSADMKLLTVIEAKTKVHESLTKADLVFLYELERPIQGFGYRSDPRIAELRKGRNKEEDMPIVFDCAKEQIARVPADINERTKAYVGPLEVGIFQKLPDGIEHMYSRSFPEGRIKRYETEIGGMNKPLLLAELKKREESKQIRISDNARFMIESEKFTTAPTRERLTLFRLTVADLGFPDGATTDQIYTKANELGLELCPAETGPRLRLSHKDQPVGEWLRIAMKQITDRDGSPNVFNVGHDGDGRWLNDRWAEPTRRRDADFSFVFRFRKEKL